MSGMKADPEGIIDARGYFWWSDAPCPHGAFAPELSVPGRLIVGSGGHIRLELDGSLSGGGAAGAFKRHLSGDQEVKGQISGALIATAEKVILLNLFSNGASHHQGAPVRESFIAHECLVTRGSFPKDMIFRWLELSLEGYEDWLGLQSIQSTRTRRAVRAEYRMEASQYWVVDENRIEVERQLKGWTNGREAELTWRESALFRYGVRSRMNVAAAIEAASQLGEFITLLSDCDREMAFPVVRASRKSAPVTVYYPRSRSPMEAAQWHRSWATFDACKADFGNLFGKYLKRRADIGPGFFLYLASRRTESMYAEHRFISLVWGLESLHRSLNETRQSAKYKAKIDRLVGQISKPSDQKWLRGRLERADETTLSDRIDSLAKGLPLTWEAKDLRRFSDLCAERRNDLSHFGGAREGREHDNFIEDILRLSEALDIIYHAALLKEIGLDAALLKSYFLSGPRAYPVGKCLAAVGLSFASE